MIEIHQTAARGFAAVADVYERGRPSYPAEAIDALVEILDLRAGRRVLDLGAGTGKLTRLLAPSGADVVALEPVAEMRHHLRRWVPTAEILDGAAEAIPLPNGSVDAAVAGQAFHWFDNPAALSEIRRVLRPDSRLALIWQVLDESRPWVARLSELIDQLAGDTPRFRNQEWQVPFELTRLFERLERRAFRNVQRGDLELMLDRIGSISYVAMAPAEVREALIARARVLFESELDARDGTVELPYETRLFWTTRTEVPAGTTAGLVASVNVSAGGVPKRPVGRVLVRRLGMEGDGHDEPEPSHGGPLQAVSIHSLEAIARVAADGHRAFPGAFGENLTLIGLELDTFRPGDLLRIGEHGVVLEITKRCEPCKTLQGWFIDGRIGRLSSKLYPADGRWYARVLEEGRIATSDRVEHVRTSRPAGVETAASGRAT